MTKPVAIALTSFSVACITPIATCAQSMPPTNDAVQGLGSLVAWLLAGAGVLALIVASIADQRIRKNP